MKIPTPQRIVVVLWSLTWQRLRRLPGTVHYLLWMTPRAGLLYRQLKTLRDHLVPKDSLLGFFLKMYRVQRRMRTPQFQRNVAAGNATVFCDPETERLRAAGGPILYISWHSGAGKIENLAGVVDPSAKMFTAYGFYIKNMVRADALSLAKLHKILSDGGRAMLAFEGKHGKRDLNSTIFGLPWSFSRSFIWLARTCDVPVVPFTSYVDKRCNISFYIGAPLFDGSSLAKLSDQQALEKTIKYFCEDLQKKDPYHLSYPYLLFPDKLLMIPR